MLLCRRYNWSMIQFRWVPSSPISSFLLSLRSPHEHHSSISTSESSSTMSKLSGNVLITGANGFLGLHVVDQTLKLTELKVKAVVRSEKSAQEVKKAFSSAIENRRLGIAFVPNMEEERAYDEVIQDIDYVIHLASPLPATDFSPETVGNVYLKPTIRGVERLLEASSKTESVKKVVLTSSIAAIAGRKFKDLDETDWRDTSYERALKAANSFDAYFASKTLAEKAAWEFLETHSPSFTLTVLNPTFIFGPTMLPSAVSGTNEMAWNSMTKDRTDLFTVGCVDVRDTAKAHVTALINKEVTDGKRYIIHSETPSPSQMIDIAHRNFPEHKALWAKAVPVEPLGPKAPVCSYTSKTLERSSKDLGVEFRAIEESVVDFVKGFLSYQASNLPRARI